MAIKDYMEYRNRTFNMVKEIIESSPKNTYHIASWYGLLDLSTAIEDIVEQLDGHDGVTRKVARTSIGDFCNVCIRNYTKKALVILEDDRGNRSTSINHERNLIMQGEATIEDVKRILTFLNYAHMKMMMDKHQRQG